MGKRWLLTALCLAMLFMGGCASAQELDKENSVSWAYPVSMEELHQEYIRLVNRENLLPSDYVPQDLIKIKVKKASSSTIQMCQMVSDVLDAMFAAASADGVTLYAKSGYRSYQTQNSMYRNRLEQNNGKDDGVVAYPGASDHQTGLGIDVVSKEWSDKKLNPNFAKTSEAQWMAAHCAEYGFIIRYPEGKEDITNIIYEPWHLRYVGIEAARYMTDSGLTLEEFTAQWQQALSDFEAGGGDANQVLEQSQTDGQDSVGEQGQTAGQVNSSEQYTPPQGPVILEEVGADGDPEVTLFH